MDFKKAYEDAIERAKNIYNENPSSSTAKFVCGQIFPELKESEDERIRKEIIAALRQLDSEKSPVDTYHYLEWADWLEKQKEQKTAEWNKDDELHLQNAILAAEKEWGADSHTVEWLKAIHPHPAKSPLAEGVYYIKDGKPVAEYEDCVETDRLLIIGKYCRFYISMADLGMERFAEAQKKSESLGEGWRCPDSFEGRTIGKMSDEIREKAAKIGAEHFKDKGWFWTNEVFDRWSACLVDFRNGNVLNLDMNITTDVLALSAFQN